MICGVADKADEQSGAGSVGFATTAPNRVLAGFSCSCGFFSAMLHQFLSAEAIQVPEETVLFSFLGVLFLSHDCTILDSNSYVNETAFDRPL
jgi:hypothetical protein